MIKNLLMLQYLKIHGSLIDIIAKHFEEDEFQMLFKGDTIGLQFKYNIFKDDELDILSNKNLIEKAMSFADNVIKESERHNIKILHYYEDAYPSNLKKMVNRPLIVYAKGNVNLLQSSNSIACVGTRRPTKNAVETVEHLVKGLIRDHQVIVSGLAVGIDAEAHKNCLKSNGKTIAVLAHGLDMIYPPENKNLAEEILGNEGVLLSEYPPNTKIVKRNFVARNRIVAGISNAVIVFEAKEDSGTMHTARFAYVQNKKIFCPLLLNETFEDLSTGVLKLLNTNSAFLIKNSEELINILKTSDLNELEILKETNPKVVKSQGQVKDLPIKDNHKSARNVSVEISANSYNELSVVSEQQHISIENLISFIIAEYLGTKKGEESDE